MSAQGVEEASTGRGLAASLVSVTVLIVVVLGLSAYWWHIAAIDACAVDHLRVSLGQPQNAAGTSYMDVRLTNTGVGRCSLIGYPTAFLTDGNGTVLGLGAATSSLYLPTKLTIAHNASVHAVVGFPNAANFQPGSCSRASNDLSIYPPGLAMSLKVPFTQYSCPGFSITALRPGI